MSESVPLDLESGGVASATNGSHAVRRRKPRRRGRGVLAHMTPLIVASSSDNESVSSDRTAPPHSYCLICYSDDLPRHRGITPCGHDDVCAPCHLRLRFLHSEFKCVVCKALNGTLIVDRDDAAASTGGSDEVRHKTFAQYASWGDDLGPDFVFRDDVGMFVPKDYHETDVLPLFSMRCNAPDCDFLNETESYIVPGKYSNAEETSKLGREVKRVAGLNALNAHLKNVHALTLCHLCVEHKRDFVSALPRFSAGALKVHQARGEGLKSAFKGHPLCKFCAPHRFYDLTKLHEHLNKEHYKCHVCDKQGNPNQFFRNYDRLAAHFDRDHFMCHDPQCLAARFVVFENEIDLGAHEVNVHGGSLTNSGSTKIQLQFRVRRSGYDGSGYEQQRQSVPNDDDFQYGLDGEVFVPDALPSQQQAQENEPAITHAAHAIRTAELRAEAARVRALTQVKNQQEAFPSLASASLSGTDRKNLVGWTADGRASVVRPPASATAMTEENFPSLGGTTDGGRKGAAVKARQKTGANNQFAAMRMAAMGKTTAAPSVSSWSSSAAASRPAAQSSLNLASENFPSLSGPTTTRTIPTNDRSNLSSNNFTSLRTGIGAARSTPGNNNNSEANLSLDNFPSLLGGGGSSGKKFEPKLAPRYTAAEALAKKKNAVTTHQPRGPEAAFLAHTMNFPSPSPFTNNNNNNTKTTMTLEKTPVLESSRDFPPPPGGSTTSGKTLVESMKSTLGTARYKKLKSLTRDFVSNDLSADTYVDQTASLFAKGLLDDGFWSFVPSLIMSCPNEQSVSKAMRYLESLRVANEMQEAEFGSNSSNISIGGGWASAASSSGPSQAQQTHHYTTPMGSFQYNAATNSVVPSRGATSEFNSRVGSSVQPPVNKLKGAWSKGGGN